MTKSDLFPAYELFVRRKLRFMGWRHVSSHAALAAAVAEARNLPGATWEVRQRWACGRNFRRAS